MKLMNKFLFFLACAGACIAVMAVVSNELQSFAPGAILLTSALMNAVMTRRSTIATYTFTAIVCVFLLNIVRENFVHYGHITDTAINFTMSAILTFLFGALPIWLKNHEYKIYN